MYAVYDRGLGLQEVATIAPAPPAGGGAAGDTPSLADAAALITCVRISDDCSRFAAGLGSGELKVYAFASTTRTPTGTVVFSSNFHAVSD